MMCLSTPLIKLFWTQKHIHMGFQYHHWSPTQSMLLFNTPLCGKVVQSETSCLRTSYVAASRQLMTSTRTRLIMAHLMMNRVVPQIYNQCFFQRKGSSCSTKICHHAPPKNVNFLFQFHSTPVMSTIAGEVTGTDHASPKDPSVASQPARVLMAHGGGDEICSEVAPVIWLLKT